MASIAVFAPVVVAVAFAAEFALVQDHSQKGKQAPLLPEVHEARPREQRSV